MTKEQFMQTAVLSSENLTRKDLLELSNEYKLDITNNKITMAQDSIFCGAGNNRGYVVLPQNHKYVFIVNAKPLPNHKESLDFAVRLMIALTPNVEEIVISDYK